MRHKPLFPPACALPASAENSARSLPCGVRPRMPFFQRPILFSITPEMIDSKSADLLQKLDPKRSVVRAFESAS